MSDRIIRDELLTSERYWAVSNEAKLLYLHLILNADDTARFSGKNFTLRTACFPSQAMEPAHMERLLDELQTQDLIRLYAIENERFVFIPRFKQRLRFINSKFPEPPKEINDLEIKKSDSSQTKDVPKSDSSQQKRSEEKRREVNIAPPDGVPHSVWQDFVKHRKSIKAPLTGTAVKGIEREAKKAGISLNDAIQEICARGWRGFKAEWVTTKPESMSTQDLEKALFK